MSCDNCGKQNTNSMLYGRLEEYYLCPECFDSLVSSIETSEEITEPGEWNFTKEGQNRG